MYYKSVSDLNACILGNLHQLPRDVDLVVGIPRSGMLAANLIALYLNLPLTDLNGLCERRLLSWGKRAIRTQREDVFAAGSRVLVVDDCISQGTELRKAQQQIADANLPVDCIYACVYGFPESPRVVDIVMEVVPRPMCFQWSCIHSSSVSDYCFDIDGVLCANPTKAQDDDGAEYEKFLRDTSPLLLPTAEVGWLVTCRLEKYRAQTEAWLRRHGVRYRQLIMMDYPDQAARARANASATFKAKVYRETGALLFIESCPGLAALIAQESGLPVLCMESNQMMRPSLVTRINIAQQRMGWWWRRAKRAPGKIKRIVQQRLAVAAAPTE
jgi:uncharacterized HAD superfamily protein